MPTMPLGHPIFVRSVLALACLPLAACALLSKNEPLTPRYFTLAEEPEGVRSPRVSSNTGPNGPLLALGRVVAGAQLHERILYRSGDHEVAYYDDRRWSERPDVYLRRALQRALFQERGLREAVSGAAPTLQAELQTFEEIRGKEPRVRMQVLIALDDGRTMQLTETVTVDAPVSAAKNDDAQANAVAAAFDEALHTGVEQIADHVLTKLQASLAPAAP